MLELLGDDGEIDVDGFWSTVDDNLQQHKVRLLFVSDHAPRELRRLVEFLNEEMANVEVLIVEVKQYKNSAGGLEKALVPRVLGMTEAARATKTTTKKVRRFTTRAEFLSKCPPEARDFFTEVLDIAAKKGYIIYWGEVGFSIRGRLGDGERLVFFVYGYPPSKFQFHFHNDVNLDRSKDSPFRRELLDFGVFSESGQYTLTSEITPENKDELKKVYDFILEKVKEFEIEFHPELRKKCVNTI